MAIIKFTDVFNILYKLALNLLTTSLLLFIQLHWWFHMRSKQSTTGLVAAFIIWMCITPSAHAGSKPVIIATMPALAQIAEAIGGIDVEVQSLVLVGQNPNIFFIRPSHIRNLSRADLLFSVGFGLESSWLSTLIHLSKNPKVTPGMQGYFSGDDAIEAIGVPRGMTSDTMEQWSSDTNPYWWLDPELGIKVALALAIRMSEIDPVNAERYQQRVDAFVTAIRGALPRWRDYMDLHTGAIITYHSTYVYFMKSMNIELAGFVEPKSGIEPSTRHLDNLVDIIRQKKVKLIWVEPYNSKAIAQRIADAAGIRLMVLPDSVAGFGAKGYIGMFDRMIERIARWSQ